MTNNREIKFRGMLTKERVWVYGIYDPYRYRIGSYLRELQTEPFWHYVDHETVGQYTGLKDKNGKEIFEGDIVEAWSQGVKGKGKVTQRIDGSWLFYPSYQHNIEWELCINQYGETDVVVIGNIYENPELLGGEMNG